MSDENDDNENIEFRVPDELKVSFEDVFKLKNIIKFPINRIIFKVIKLEDHSFGVGLDNSCFEIYRKTPDDKYEKTTILVIDEEKNSNVKIKKFGTLENGDIIIYIKQDKIVKINKTNYNMENLQIPLEGLGHKFEVLSEDRLLFYGGDYFESKSLCIYSAKEPYNKLFNYDFIYRKLYCYEDRRKNYLICLLCQEGEDYDKGFILNIFDLKDYTIIKEFVENDERGMFNRIRSSDTVFFPLKDNKLLTYSYSHFIIINLDKLIIEKKIGIGRKETFLFYMFNFCIEKNLLPFMTIEKEKEEYCDTTIDEEDTIKLCYFNVDTYEITHKEELVNLMTWGRSDIADDDVVSVFKREKENELILYKL